MSKPHPVPTLSLDSRPESYWDPADPLTALIANVKGQGRRAALRAHLSGVAPLPDAEPLLQDELTDGQRRAWGSLHPALMGGEYLPPYLVGEVEIARVVLASVTQDVISIRARRDAGGRIHYRAVDEYDSVLTCSPRSSAKPLTLGAMARLLGRIGTGKDRQEEDHLTQILRMNLESTGDAESLEGFFTVESPFYPALPALMDHHFHELLRGMAPEPEEEEEDDE